MISASNLMWLTVVTAVNALRGNNETLSTNRYLLQNYQPKAVVVVESNPSTRMFASISFPHGSAWCDGKPTYWLVGHQPGDSPWCLVDDTVEDFTDYDYGNSVWEQNSPAFLDRKDELNAVDGPANIDRHSCTTLDVNQDGVPDVICGVGANKGTGYGYNELYITQTEADIFEGVTKNSLVKIKDGHGLHKYPTMRNRLMVSVKGADGSSLIFLATRGEPREDGQENNHRMFRLIDSNEPSSIFFTEVKPNPWSRYTKASCLHVVDVNNDGLDDILMCNLRKKALLYVQNANSTWTEYVLTGSSRAKDWRNARVADITGDGIPDLIVVGNGGQNQKSPTSYVRIFEGTGIPPYFDFATPDGLWYGKQLTYASPDVEILDVNNDGVADLYVVQANEAALNTYCGPQFSHKNWWQGGSQPPASFVPPPDTAPDLLLIGNSNNFGRKFMEVYMEHSIPGCGFFVEKFGNDRTMILSHGGNEIPGQNAVLQW